MQTGLKCTETRRQESPARGPNPYPIWLPVPHPELTEIDRAEHHLRKGKKSRGLSLPIVLLLWARCPGLGRGPRLSWLSVSPPLSRKLLRNAPLPLLGFGRKKGGSDGTEDRKNKSRSKRPTLKGSPPFPTGLPPPFASTQIGHRFWGTIP